jgi:hypothetical protein
VRSESFLLLSNEPTFNNDNRTSFVVCNLIVFEHNRKGEAFTTCGHDMLRAVPGLELYYALMTVAIEIDAQLG